MTENINTSKPRSLGIFSKFIIITTILLVILGPLGLMEFLIGLLSPLFTPIIPFVIYMASCIFILITIFASFFWKKYVKNKIYGWLMPFGVIFLFVVFFYLIAPSPYVAFLHGFKSRVKHLADTSEIRNWLGSLEEGELNGEWLAIHSIYPNWPEDVGWQNPLKNFTFHALILDKDENGEPVLFAIYHGWIEEWGFVIGDPNMENVHPWTEGNFILPVEQGVYVWVGRLGYWGNSD